MRKHHYTYTKTTIINPKERALDKHWWYFGWIEVWIILYCNYNKYLENDDTNVLFVPCLAQPYYVFSLFVFFWGGCGLGWGFYFGTKWIISFELVEP